MLVRTWPYGTTKRARVLRVEQSMLRGGAFVVITLEGEDREGYLLVERADQTPGVKTGDVGRIVFTKGGPTGGYWKFTKDEETTS